MPEACYGMTNIPEDDRAVSDFVAALLKMIPGNFIVRQTDDDNRFYFLCGKEGQRLPAFNQCGLLVIHFESFNEHLFIGFGLGDVCLSGRSVFRCKDKATYQMWYDVLDFTFFRKFTLPDYFNYESRFKGTMEVGGIKCYFIHEYSPAYLIHSNRSKEREIRQVRNNIFAFKDGEKPQLWAKVFSLCIKCTPELDETLGKAVIVPIPASTRQKNILRFSAFSRLLSGMLEVEDGFRTTWIQYDREEMKGKTEKNTLQNLSFNKKYVEKKHVILIDDILTTGSSLRQMGKKMLELGALSVVGVFFGKTV